MFPLLDGCAPDVIMSMVCKPMQMTSYTRWQAQSNSRTMEMTCASQMDEFWRSAALRAADGQCKESSSCAFAMDRCQSSLKAPKERHGLRGQILLARLRVAKRGQCWPSLRRNVLSVHLGTDSQQESQHQEVVAASSPQISISALSLKWREAAL